MTPHEAAHLWVRFVGLDNVTNTLREEFDALPCDLLTKEAQVEALVFLQHWILAILEL